MKEINNHFIKVEQYCQKFIFFFNFCAVLQTGIKKRLHVVSNTRSVRKLKIHHVKDDREIFYAYYGKTVVELDPLPVSRAHLTVVELALFE